MGKGHGSGRCLLPKQIQGLPCLDRLSALLRIGAARPRPRSPTYAADPAGYSVQTGRFKPISDRYTYSFNANGLIFRAVDDRFEASFCPGLRLFAVQAVLESLSAPRPNAGAHRAGPALALAESNPRLHRRQQEKASRRAGPFHNEQIPGLGFSEEFPSALPLEPG
jgi:hypothetical protein